jgi:hypothetical protein
VTSPSSIESGLCARCRHAEALHSSRGSVFTLCRLSAEDARFPKYPRLPVLSCEGFAPRDHATTDPPGGEG